MLKEDPFEKSLEKSISNEKTIPNPIFSKVEDFLNAIKAIR